MVENYLLAQFNKSNGNALVRSAKAAAGAVRRLRRCRRAAGARAGAEEVHLQRRNNGQLARIYQQTEGASLPPMPLLVRFETRRRHAPPPGDLRLSHCRLLIVGGGPAGLAAAAENCGARRRGRARRRRRLSVGRSSNGRATRPERGGAGRDHVRGLVDQTAEQSGARLLLERAASCGNRTVLVSEGRRARSLPASSARSGARPAGRVPRLDAARRADPGAAQTIVKAHRTPGERLLFAGGSWRCLPASSTTAA